MYENLPLSLGLLTNLPLTKELEIYIGPQKKMVFEPNSSFAYNNSGYIILAAIVAKVSGERYVDYVTIKSP